MKLPKKLIAFTSLNDAELLAVDGGWAGVNPPVVMGGVAAGIYSFITKPILIS